MTGLLLASLADVDPGRPVIVGGGIAGLSVALAATVPVTLFMPGGGASTCTRRAQGGIAAATADDDSPAAHARDTMRAGAGLSRDDVVETVTQEAPDVITWLEGHGVVFDAHADGSHRLGLEGAHSHPRIHHGDGDGTGRVLHAALLRAARAADHVDVRCGVEVREVTTAHGRVVGVRCGVMAERDADRGTGPGTDVVLPCAQVVLATGGYAAMYAHTTNPPQAWGSGIALAARAGATLQDLEMVQFHPTALDAGSDPLPLVSEAVRGAGAGLVDDAGEPLVDDDLAARDVVAAAVFTARAGGRRVFLRLPAPLRETFDGQFPAIAASCRAHGLDPTSDVLPVVTAAHYTMGGIRTDADGATDVSGLFAVGECASSGLHGANRLASNSLLEGVVIGRRVAARLGSARVVTASRGPARIGSAPPHSGSTQRASAQGDAARFASAQLGWPGSPRFSAADTSCRAAGVTPHHRSPSSSLRAAVESAMGPVRSRERVHTLLEKLRPRVASDDASLVAALMAASALRRMESRGAHRWEDRALSSSPGEHTHVSLGDVLGDSRTVDPDPTQPDEAEPSAVPPRSTAAPMARVGERTNRTREGHPASLPLDRSAR